MAIVGDLQRRDFEKYSPHTEVEATYSVIEEPDGSKTLQIDTYGSKQRQIPGKVSQTIRFTSAALKQLAGIIGEHFSQCTKQDG